MEIYKTQDNLVTKYIHLDGSETAIKMTPSCRDFSFEENGEIKSNFVDRNKYVVFVSSSVGCPYSCQFCYLTTKKFLYYKLSCDEILNNLKNSIFELRSRDKSISQKYIKLSFMGMGDAFLLNDNEIKFITIELFDWAINHGYAKGIDGVDIGTINIKQNKIRELIILNERLIDAYPINPLSKDRSPVRIFYSLHSAIESTRNYLLNINVDLREQESLLDIFTLMDIDIIIHYVLLDGYNDYKTYIGRLIYFIAKNNYELRLLRFNKCPNSKFNESTKFIPIVKELGIILKDKVKYQVSAGSEIMASCGMFLCKKGE